MQHLREQNSRIIPRENQRNCSKESWFKQTISDLFRMPEKVSDQGRVIAEDLVIMVIAPVAQSLERRSRRTF